MRNRVLMTITLIAVIILVLVLAGEGWPPAMYGAAGFSGIWLILFGYANLDFLLERR